MPLTHAQQSRLERFGIQHSVDLHCHCLPGIDDGPPSLPDALALCRLFVRDGFTDLIATPHQLGRWDGLNLAADVRHLVVSFQQVLDSHGIPLRVHPGGEVRLDERIPVLLDNDQVLTLADRHSHLLLELPSAGRVVAASVMAHLASSELSIVLAHAERYQALMHDPAVAREWIDAGAFLQVNAGSLLGAFGPVPQEVAWQLLEGGMASVVASDAHSTGGRRPRMTEALEAIADQLGEDVAKRVCLENPLNILTGQPLVR